MTVDADNSVRREPIGVHTLTEFVYCARAGLISLYEDKEDPGEEDSVPNLNYIPFYDIKEIDAELRIVEQEIVWLAGVVVLLAVFSLLAVIFSPLLTGMAVLAVAVLLAIYPIGQLRRRIRRHAKLHRLRREYLSDEGRVPDLNNPEPEELDWRHVIRYGFDLEKTHDKLFDPEIGLAGKPWKVLRRGELCIPVFRCRPTKPKSENRTDPANWLYQQHHVRMAAYCQLIESATGFKAPFGLVLFAGDFRVFAIKLTPMTISALKAELKKARSQIEAHRKGKVIKPPSPKVCRNCPLGSLQRYESGFTDLMWNGKPRSPNLQLVYGDAKHSKCGDAFSWIPPHKYTEEKDAEGVLNAEAYLDEYYDV